MAVTVTQGGAGSVFRRRLLKRDQYESGAGRATIGGPFSIRRFRWGVTGLVDNTAATFATILMPNVKIGASLFLRVVTTLGDGDSTEISEWNIALSRIAGAASLIALTAKSVNANTAGVTANAQTTVSNVAVAGANTVQQSFALQIKNARSAGVSDTHAAFIEGTLVNLLAGGAYIQ